MYFQGYHRKHGFTVSKGQESLRIHMMKLTIIRSPSHIHLWKWVSQNFTVWYFQKKFQMIFAFWTYELVKLRMLIYTRTIKSKYAGPAKTFTMQIYLWIHQMLATILSLLVFQIDWYWSKFFHVSNINWSILAKSLCFSHMNLLILIETLKLFTYKSTGFR